jgi:hypothetical protein
MTPKDILTKSWQGLEILSTIATGLVILAVALGWRISKPAERFDSIERGDVAIISRVTALENDHVALNSQLHMLLRLECLGTTRHDADLAGACAGLPTKDKP